MHGFAPVYGSAVGQQAAGEHIQKRGFAHAVAAHNPDAVLLLEHVRKIADKHLAVERFGNIFQFYDLAAEAFGLHAQFHLGGGLGAGGFGLQVIKRIHAVFGLGAACLGHPAHPFQFLAHQVAGLFGFGGLLGFAFAFFLQEITVVALVAVKLPLVNLDNHVGHRIQEIPVVGDEQQRHILRRQMVFEPLNGLQVQVVGRFVKDYQVRLFNQYPRQSHAFALPARKLPDGLVQVMDVQRTQHLLHLRFVIPGLGGIHLGDGGFKQVHIFGVRHGVLVAFNGPQRRVLRGEKRVQNSQVQVKIRVLRQEAQGDFLARAHAPFVGSQRTGQNVEQRAFAHAIGPHNGDFFALAHTKGDVAEQPAVAEGFGNGFGG